ncbi:MAG: MFS transporter [Pseudomonadota bacterium]
MAQPLTPPCQRDLIEAQPCPGEQGIAFPVLTKRMVLAACVLASSMAFIDGSGLTVAMPAIRDAFDADLASLQWVLNVYALALAALSLIGGAIADAKGRVRILIVGVAVFAIASVGCAMSSSIGTLIAARGVQGIGAAFMVPASLALIGSVYPKEERAGAIGVWAAVSALMTSAGPPLGGWLTEAFGWEAVFLINPPLAIIATVILLRFGPKTQHKEQDAFDWAGAASLAVFLAALAMGVSAFGGEGGELPVPPALSFLVAAVTLTFFLWREGRARAPIMPPDLFTEKTFTLLNLATLFLYAALSLLFFQLPFFLIERFGISATEAGAAFLPFTLAVGLLSNPVGSLAGRLGLRTLIAMGSGCAALAFVWMAVTTEAGFLFAALVPMGVLGLGFALIVGPLTTGVMGSLGDADQGLASGVNNTVSRIAQLIGVAGAAALGAGTVSFQWGAGLAALLSAAALIAALATEMPVVGSAE